MDPICVLYHIVQRIHILCVNQSKAPSSQLKPSFSYWVTQKLPQTYTANPATFPMQIRKFTVQICGNFWVTQYIYFLQ